MNKPIATATGRVWTQAKLITPDNGSKPFVDLTVKLAPRSWNGKTYFQKVYVRSYTSGSVALIPKLTPDTLVTVTGEADAVAEQGKDGKSYANVRIVGNVSLLDGDTATTTGTSQERTPAPATRTATTQGNDEESVPF